MSDCCHLLNVEGEVGGRDEAEGSVEGGRGGGREGRGKREC